MRASAAVVLSLLAGLPTVLSFTTPSFVSYDNDFIDPKYVLSKSWNENTTVSQQSIVQWADFLAAQGPWAVTTSKPFNAPSGDPHDYLSWAPYWFPDCSKVHNTTALTQEQIWVTCPYVSKDGQFNPDRELVNNTGAFDALSNAVFYNSIAWAISGSSSYSTNVATFIKTWFLDDATKMNPNLNYGQVIRGPPGNQFGAHTGVLDLKCMAKLVSGILVLRGGNSTEWTSDVDSQFVAWAKTYIQWLTTSKIALGEATATNNHGTFYYNQLASLQILVGDTDGAKASLQKYFSTLYQDQINAKGEQPLEAIRTRPYHYRSYNLAAMITNARLAAYVGYDAWNLTTKAGGTIHAALDFTMTVKPDEGGASELFYSAAAVASQFGDPQGKYAAYLAQSEPAYPAEPWYFWNQPLSDSGWVRANAPSTPGGASQSQSGGAAAKPTGNNGSNNGAAGSDVRRGAAVVAGVVGLAVALLA